MTVTPKMAEQNEMQPRRRVLSQKDVASQIPLENPALKIPLLENNGSPKPIKGSDKVCN